LISFHFIAKNVAGFNNKKALFFENHVRILTLKNIKLGVISVSITQKHSLDLMIVVLDLEFRHNLHNPPNTAPEIH
jgi:hypothetical protein